MSPILRLAAATFESQVLASPLPILVHFGAPWCAPCELQDDILRIFARQSAGTLRLGQVDVEAEEDLMRAYHIHQIPTLLLFQEGKVVARHVGIMRPVDGKLPDPFRTPGSGAEAC